MAGFYKVHTLTKGLLYKVSFECEKCGKRNETFHISKVQSAWDDRMGFGRPSLEQREIDAKSQLLENTDKFINKVEGDSGKRNYRKLHLTCRCCDCKNLPAWAFPSGKWLIPVRVIAKISIFVTILILLFILMGIIDHSYESIGFDTFKTPLITVIPGALYYIAGIVYIIVQSIRVKKMDERFLPVLEQVKTDGRNEN